MQRLFLKHFLIALLLVVSSISAQAARNADVDGDGNVNITDVTALIDILLNGTSSNADVNGDGVISITDVTDLIDILLTGQIEPNPDGGDYIDLGLPSGTIWATRNVGAASPEDYGDYFAWGETEPKSNYTLNSYKWYIQGYVNGYLRLGYTKYCTDSRFGYEGFVDNKTELDPSDDAACSHYPGGRMPSLEQIQELSNCCTWQRTSRNGVAGQLVTGPNGNTLFFPFSGYRNWESLFTDGYPTFYWSRTLLTNDSVVADAYALEITGLYMVSGAMRFCGCAVRAVHVL